ncbi:MAG TPA: threo-3-hydroxy-L-aspartate ammonia-lyase [Paenalcaligenes hominis]|uniref:Threo-3-hydroxy-L-aspartate ammonia-lyase n=1 Tax=Paenalcaligenes hominis TaxID=643674 RepID=A0A9D2VHL1_9BURK|nr:threo-3-hydroxy-L-aspartate ammonia-lyase [Paenalcaligenes hominis]
MKLPSYDEVLQAAQRLRLVAHTTPVLRSSWLDQQLKAQVFFKCENFQRIGAFKFRGGYNALAALTPKQRQRGVVAFSSGNHAQAVALAAQLLNVPAVIVMPASAPAVKKAATLGYGAKVIEYDRLTEDREHIAQQWVEQHGLTLIPPFADRAVIAGQGTAAKELFDEVGGLDALYVPLGGGGLLSGSLLSAHALSPDCRVYGVEPEQGNDAQQSLARGEIVTITPPQSIADGALTQALAPLTFAILQQYAAGVLTVTDPELIRMLRFFAERMKIVVEPTGCLGAAALWQQRAQLKGKRVGVIISGGNVDVTDYARLLTAGQNLQS